MNLLLFVVAGALMVLGFVGAVIPVLPGIPMIFCGIWLAARLDDYHHLGLGWLAAIAAVGAVGVLADVAAGAVGARRLGATPRAVGGALLGTVVGFLFGLPGVLLGPFVGAVLGELSSGSSVLRSTTVGVGTWVGMLVGTLVKLVASVTMLTLFAAGWWWNAGSTLYPIGNT